MKFIKFSIILLVLSLSFVACSSSDDSVEQQESIIPEKDLIVELKRNIENKPVLELNLLNSTNISYEITTGLKTLTNFRINKFTFQVDDFFIGNNEVNVFEVDENERKVSKDKIIYNHSVFADRTSLKIEVKKDDNNRIVALNSGEVITGEPTKYTSIIFELNNKKIGSDRVSTLILNKADLIKGENKLTVTYVITVPGIVSTNILDVEFFVKESDL